MIVEYRQTNIFDTRAQALVNPVNCQGVTERGLAAQFGNHFPVTILAPSKPSTITRITTKPERRKTVTP